MQICLPVLIRPPVLALFAIFTVASPSADPVMTFGTDVIGQAVISSPVDRFWSEYPQYAADNAPFVVTRLGFRDENWSVDAQFDLFRQYNGWQWTNLPIPDAKSDRKFPVEYHGLRKADFVYDFHPLVVAIGRSKVHWGSTQDSLLIADQIPFLDRIALHLPMGNWALDSLVASPETRIGEETDFTETTLQVAHRLSYRRGEFEIGFTEQAIIDRNVYGADGAIVQRGNYSLADVFPFFSVHEGDIKPYNTSMVLDASWTTGRWRLAVESGFDEFDARIFGIPDDPLPAIWASIAELSWSKDPWTWTLSAGKTHYLWGNFDTRLGKAQYHLLLDNGVQMLPLTSPYGPGATWGTFALRYQGGRVTFDGRVEVWGVLRGVSLDTAYVEDTPERVYDLYSRVHLFATWARQNLSVTMGPQVLFAHGLLTEQWFFQVTTRVGQRGL